MFKYVETLCGCGNPAEFVVYDHEEPHCKDCMVEAVTVPMAVKVRQIDIWDRQTAVLIKPTHLMNRRNKSEQ